MNTFTKALIAATAVQGLGIKSKEEGQSTDAENARPLGLA